MLYVCDALSAPVGFEPGVPPPNGFPAESFIVQLPPLLTSTLVELHAMVADDPELMVVDGDCPFAVIVAVGEGAGATLTVTEAGGECKPPVF